MANAKCHCTEVVIRVEAHYRARTLDKVKTLKTEKQRPLLNNRKIGYIVTEILKVR